MALAGMLARHPCELRADFQRVYGLDLDDMGAAFTCSHAADLAVMLQADSLTMRAENPTLEWSDTDYMLWSIEFSLRVLRWQRTEDGMKGRNRPRPLPTPNDRARVRGKAEQTDLARIAQELNLNGLGG